MEDILSRLPPFVLLATYAGLWTLEGFQAARPNARKALRGRRNLAMSGFGLFIGAAAGSALMGLAAFSERTHWGIAAIEPSSPLLAALAGVLLLDCVDYWRHRISHAAPLLWRLHRVHHSDPQMDVTTSLRSHPLEFALRPVLLGAAILVFGIPMLATLIYPVVQLPVLVFQHANIRLSPKLDSLLLCLIATPAMHVVHHSRRPTETNSNYATFLTIWDRLFGSLRPSKEPAAIGLDGFDDEASQKILGMLAEPWRKRAGDRV